MTTISVDDGETLDFGAVAILRLHPRTQPPRRHAHPPLPLDDEERQANPPDLPSIPRYGAPRTRVPAHHARSAQFHGQRDSHVRRVLRRRDEGRQKCFWQETRIDAKPDCLMAQSCTTLSNQEEFCGAWLTLPGESTAFAEGKTVTATADVLLAPGQAMPIDKRRRRAVQRSAGGRPLAERAGRDGAEQSRLAR